MMIILCVCIYILISIFMKFYRRRAIDNSTANSYTDLHDMRLPPHTTLPNVPRSTTYLCNNVIYYNAYTNLLFEIRRFAVNCLFFFFFQFNSQLLKLILYDVCILKRAQFANGIIMRKSYLFYINCTCTHNQVCLYVVYVFYERIIV